MTRCNGRGRDSHDDPKNAARRLRSSRPPPEVAREKLATGEVVALNAPVVRKVIENAPTRVCDSIARLLGADHVCSHEIVPGPPGQLPLLARVPGATGLVPSSDGEKSGTCGCPWKEYPPAGHAMQWIVAVGHKHIRVCACRLMSSSGFSEATIAASRTVGPLLGPFLGGGGERFSAVSVEPIADAAPHARRETELRRRSFRQEQVRQLIEQGMTRKDIALALGLSEETVKTHTKRLAEKDQDDRDR